MNYSKCIDIYLSTYPPYSGGCIQSLLLGWMVYQMNDHSFSKALKKRILFNCFGVCIRCKSFWSVLWAFPLLYSSRQFGDHNLEFSVEEWRSVLKLVSLYEMTEVQVFVIKKMTPLLTEFPSLQINLAKTYNIRTWLVAGLSRLAWRAEPLSVDDVKLVGLTNSVTICALRERKRRCETCTDRKSTRLNSSHRR